LPQEGSFSIAALEPLSQVHETPPFRHDDDDAGHEMLDSSPSVVDLGDLG
jgi:hypothetical protein